MRIMITADLHFFPHQTAKHQAFAEHLETIGPDVFIIAGDIGEPLDQFATALKLYADVSPNRAALPGNHDVWHRAFSHTSQDLWGYKLEEVAKENGYLWLERENLVVGRIGICGTIAWYDYSAKIPGLLAKDSEVETLKPMFNNDGQYIDWDWRDPDFAQLVSEECIARLTQLQDTENILSILLVTHVPIFRQCLGKPGVMSAYSANLTFGEQVIQFDKLRAVISGHIHAERIAEISRNSGRPILAGTVPSDYGDPAALILDTDLWQIDIVR